MGLALCNIKQSSQFVDFTLQLADLELVITGRAIAALEVVVGHGLSHILKISLLCIIAESRLLCPVRLV